MRVGVRVRERVVAQPHQPRERRQRRQRRRRPASLLLLPPPRGPCRVARRLRRRASFGAQDGRRLPARRRRTETVRVRRQ